MSLSLRRQPKAPVGETTPPAPAESPADPTTARLAEIAAEESTLRAEQTQLGIEISQFKTWTATAPELAAQRQRIADKQMVDQKLSWLYAERERLEAPAKAATARRARRIAEIESLLPGWRGRLVLARDREQQAASAHSVATAQRESDERRMRELESELASLKGEVTT